MYGDKLIQCFANHKQDRGMLTDNENRPLPQIYGTNKVLRVRYRPSSLIQPSRNRCPILLTDEMVITLPSREMSGAMLPSESGALMRNICAWYFYGKFGAYVLMNVLFD